MAHAEFDEIGFSRRDLMALSSLTIAWIALSEILTAKAANAADVWTRPFTTYGRISRPFNLSDPRYANGHRGADYHQDPGGDSTVRAIRSGRVVYAGNRIAQGQLGETLVIQHASHWSLYAHLHDYPESSRGPFRVGVGDDVLNGTALGLKGTTGYSTGPHLHLEIGRGTWEGSSSRQSHANLVNPEALLAGAPPAPTKPRPTTPPPVEENDMFTDEDRKNLNDLVALAPTIHQINRRAETAINEGRDRAAALARIEKLLGQVASR
ncbi:Peptidase family M23 [Microbacterium sp. LKL04]|uniref:M23 family metallopeptidase n=1 Tax=Microbacterium sp. LKL04 TaxID=912630 RepID=UPI000875C396|nr:M23 family metallopeptidase [Microbacterium sp. LKL04]SCY52471.1 Peptidase family M23 [Microbacterium sp. LKL04]